MEKKPLDANQKVRYWDNSYSVLYSQSPCICAKKFYEEMKSDFKDETGKTILDIGCGDMKSMIENKGNYLVGLDSSKEALVRAKNRSRLFQNNGCDLGLVMGSAGNLPFRDGCVDRVVSIEAQQYMGHDHKQALGEASRVSKKDVVLTFRSVEEALARGIKPHNNIVLDVDGYEVALFNEADICKNLSDVGLEIKKKKIFTLDDLNEKSTVVPSDTQAAIYVECKKKA
jgi:cyclopropane fatty-acyl-phospholipid synthase-like methyltransferase